MHKQDLALNNLKWVICYKTQSNQTKQNLSLSPISLYLKFGFFFVSFFNGI